MCSCAVHLACGGTYEPVPRFLRWSYQSLVSCNILCIEDPMYFLHLGLGLGWYYGNKEAGILDVLLEIVEVVCNKKNISHNKVTFMGSSGGGYAALYAASIFPDSLSISVNPQLYIQNHPQAKAFEKITGIDLNGKDFLNRNDLPKQIEQSNSKHVILINAQSEPDWESHAKPFCEKIGLVPSYGLTRERNILFWLYDSKGAPKPHSSVETKPIFSFIDYVAEKFRVDGLTKDITNAVLMVNECWHDIYELKAENYRLREEKNSKHDFLETVEFKISPSKGKYTVGDRITVEVVANKIKGLEYAFYLYYGAEVIEKIFYQKSPECEFHLGKRGTYRIKVYIQNAEKKRISRVSERLLAV